MFKKLFGGGFKLDRTNLAKFLLGTDLRQAARYHQGFAAVLLEQLDESRIIEENTPAEDLTGDGADLIKGSVMQLLQGGPERLGFTKKELTPGQDEAAFRVCGIIASLDQGELFSAALSAATFNAMMAWYLERYLDAIAIATHVIENLSSSNGEAYRVRAFAYIMLGNLTAARDDLRMGMQVMPQMTGAAEPLAAVEQELQKI